MHYQVNAGVYSDRRSFKKLLIAGLVTLAASLFIAIPVFAAPGDNGNGNGGCVDTVYGNATNPRPSGNGVLPSQSPGPFVNTGFNEPPRNDRVRGVSIGDIQQAGHAAGFNGGETIDLVCVLAR